jgi:hypothetical protein
LIFSKETPDLLFGIRRCLWSLGTLPETLVWDRQAGLHARDGRPTEAFAAFCGQLRVGWHFCDARIRRPRAWSSGCRTSSSAALSRAASRRTSSSNASGRSPTSPASGGSSPSTPPGVVATGWLVSRRPARTRSRIPSRPLTDGSRCIDRRPTLCPLRAHFPAKAYGALRKRSAHTTPQRGSRPTRHPPTLLRNRRSQVRILSGALFGWADREHLQELRAWCVAREFVAWKPVSDSD